MAQRVLTGITTSGIPHLGNYVGAIRPAIEASREAGVESFLFLADFHALIKCDDPDRVARSRLQIAATWLACGLDPERVVFYRQSDVPEIPELHWLLTCVTAKGLMNRAHAYKAATDANLARGEDLDDGVTMGLFSYPVLMAADILLFKAHRVPVGRDQVQHIEMARDIATRFNHLYGRGQALLELPEAQVDETVAVLPGLDGRKMSKSYDNTLPLFEGGAKALRDTVARIVTDSRAPGEPKEPEGSTLVMIHDALATPEERLAFHSDLRAGLGWGDAKARTAALLEERLAPMRARYDALMAAPETIEAALQAGAVRARAIGRATLEVLRTAVGLGRGNGSVVRSLKAGATAGVKLPSFKQYREADGRFFFKLLDATGTELLVSHGLDSGRTAGQWVQRLRTEGVSAARQAPADVAPGASWEAIAQACEQLIAAAQTGESLTAPSQTPVRHPA